MKTRLFFLLLALSTTAVADFSDTDARQWVKIQPCTAGATVNQLLDQKIRGSHRDLGWRVFADDSARVFDVERAVLVSKSMELRYRWRVDASGRIQAVTERAQNLCS